MTDPSPELGTNTGPAQGVGLEEPWFVHDENNVGWWARESDLFATRSKLLTKAPTLDVGLREGIAEYMEDFAEHDRMCSLIIEHKVPSEDEGCTCGFDRAMAAYRATTLAPTKETADG